jgi:outer membrane protein assembly factor BamA
MLREKKYYIFLIAMIISYCSLVAQQASTGKIIDSIAAHSSASRVIVGDIVLNGNKKTNQSIILREMPVKTGEEYPLEVLVKKMEDARRQLMNTALFNSVIVAVKNSEGNLPAVQAGKIDIAVDVKERWYLFPVPYFKPVDRNLNQWLVEKNGSLSRVNYGAKIFYNNATGKNDKFRMWLINGYTKQLSISYDRLYIDKKLKWGMKFAFATGKNREVNYNTINDKQVFLKDENNYVRSFINASAELTYRRAIKTRHSLGIGFSSEQVRDTIIALNPSFFKSGRNSISFPGIYYSMTWLNLDYIPYPTKGYAAHLSIGKSGFNNIINIWQLHAKGSGSWPLSAKSFFNLNMYGGIKLPFKQPYSGKRFLGYGDVFMQGFEYYVIDGVAGGYLKTTFTRELLNFNIKTPAGKKGKESQRIPVRIFGKIYGNTGYVHNPQPGENSLSNKMLYSGGFGIDILTFYDVTFKLECTFNSLGQNGLFLHRKTIF